MGKLLRIWEGIKGFEDVTKEGLEIKVEDGKVRKMGKIEMEAPINCAIRDHGKLVNNFSVACA